MKLQSDDQRLGCAPRPYAGPLYLQISDLLRERIRSRRWPEGQALPSEGELAREYGVSVGTMRKALAQIEAIGWISRHQGRGTFVTNPDEASARRLNPYYHNGGHLVPVDLAVLHVAQRAASPEEASSLSLNDDRSVVSIISVRRCSEVLAVHEEVAVPARLVPGLADDAGKAPQGAATYRSDYGLVVTKIREAITAVALPADIAALLGLPPALPSLCSRRISLDADGTPLEVCVRHAITLASEYRIELS